MTTQIPLLLSDDAKAIVHRVEKIYPGAGMELSSLQTCWRPPSPKDGKRPWPDKRFYKALEEALAAGVIRWSTKWENRLEMNT